MVSADDAGGAYPFDLMGGGVHLFVDEEDAERERSLCRAFRDGSDGTRTRDLRRDRPVMALPG